MLILLLLGIIAVQAQNAIQIQNGIDAKRLDDAKALNVIGGDCTGAEVVCLGDAVGQCLNNKFVKISDCAGGLTCHVLPLVNKPGTSATCDTEADKQARFVAAGVGQSVESASAVLPPNNSDRTSSDNTSVNAPPAAPTVGAAGASSKAPETGAAANKIGDFVCIDDTQFKHFTSADKFVVESCPPGFCATRNPPNKNPCIGKANADRIDKKI